MEPTTTITAIGGLWALVELVGKSLVEGAANDKGVTLTQKLSEWLLKKTGISEKQRYREFLDAYYNAENAFIKKYGAAKGLKIFRRIPDLVDNANSNRDFLLNNLFSETLTVLNQENVDQPDLLAEFFQMVRRELWNTLTYRPLIEFYNAEEAKDISKNVLIDIKRLSNTVDPDLEALRVVIVEPRKDFQSERDLYLKQIEAFFIEHEFVGFPVMREKTPVLLKDIFVTLDLKYDGGGDEGFEEFGKVIENKERRE